MSDSDGGTRGFPPAPRDQPHVPSMPPPPPHLSPPPGYVSYGAATPGAYGSFQRIGGVGKWLRICLMVLIPVQALSVITSIGARSKARDFLAGRISEHDYTSTVGLAALLGILSFGLFLAVAVLTVIWMFRMAKNVELMQRIGTWKPGWAIGGWFVPPFVLYVIPYLMLRDLWKASDSETVGDWRRNRVAPIVTVWWVLYGLAPLAFISVTFASFQLDRTAQDAAKEIDSKFGITLASSLVQVAAAIAYLLLVRQLTDRHQRATQEA